MGYHTKIGENVQQTNSLPIMALFREADAVVTTPFAAQIRREFTKSRHSDNIVVILQLKSSEQHSMSAARQQSSPDHSISALQQSAPIFGATANCFGVTVTSLEVPHAR